MCRGVAGAILYVTAPIALVDPHPLSGYQAGVPAMQTFLPKALLPKTMARAVWLAITLAVSGMLSISAAGQALAGFCSATKCVLTLTGTNLSGIAGPYGT